MSEASEDTVTRRSEALESLRKIPLFLQVSDEVLAVFREEALRPGAARAMIHYYRAMLRGGGMRRVRERGYPMIETPTLMIWGEQDVALSKRLSMGTAKYVPNLVQRYLPKASHWVQQDQPELVNAMLEAWLDSVRA